MQDAPAGRLNNLIAALHALHIYGAAAVTSLGCAVARWLHFEPGPWIGLWFAGALFAYNLDRLVHDPADTLNTPRRVERVRRLKKISAALAVTALSALIVLPVWTRDWPLLALTTSGALLCVAYSTALVGRRLKELPILKTFLVPTVVTASIVGVPLSQQGLRVDMPVFVCATAAVWCFLFFNVLLCDMRDVEGDKRSGVFSLPVLLGAVGTRRLLALILCAAAALLVLNDWPLLAAASVIYLGALLLALQRPRTEQFYEWWVEGMLFLPAATCLLHTP